MSLKSILLIVSLHFFAMAGNGQNVSIHVKEARLEKVFKLIERQTSYSFIYNSKILQKSDRVSINVKGADVRYVLDLCCNEKAITYSIKGNDIYIKSTDSKISESLKVHEVREKNIQEKEKEDSATTWLEEMIKTGYGKTSHKLKTGTIDKVSNDNLQRQPIGSLLGAVNGVPGINSYQSSGFPGAAIEWQIRGQSSIGIIPGYLPVSSILFVVDGMPLASNNNSLQVIASSTALGGKGSNAFAAISLDDIESIEILKDADATAIYGSRGADGVVLITTKQGKAGKRLFTANVYTAINSAVTVPDMLNSRQFAEMRREAFVNDNLTPNVNNAPDLVVFDSTRDTNFKSMLLGEKARVVNAQMSFSGGDSNTQYLMSIGHRYETTVFPGNLGDKRTSLHIRLGHISADRKFSLQFSILYTIDKNRSLTTDLTSALTLAPNSPSLRDSDNNLVWQEKGVPIQNPHAYLLQPYESMTKNLIGNIQVSYKILTGITAKVNFGYNRLQFEEKSKIPGKSLSPLVVPAPTGSAFLGNNNYNGWVLEPQIELLRNIAKGDLTWLVGGSFEQVINNRSSISAIGFTNDENLTDLTTASDVLYKEQQSVYKYVGIFSRLNYNWFNKYIINLTGRRDGSSRFGPKKRLGNFGAIGTAWIFTNEEFTKGKIPFLSFGKLRWSYGITGNDQIGDYKYLDRWARTDLVYLGNPGLVPTQIADSSYSWEVTRKLEGAVELGFWQDRINLVLDFFLNRTGNQLISQMLPYATGFGSFAARNSKAVVQNSGLEITLKSNNLKKKNKSWSNELTVTFQRNVLWAFPGLADSWYATRYMEGRSLTWNIGYKYIGVDPNSGVFQFSDQNGDGKLTYPEDYIELGNLDPKFYGWFNNSVTLKNWALDIGIEFKKQMGYSNLYYIYSIGAPGTPMLNQPDIVLDRWRNPGDHATFQRFTTASNSAAAKASNNLLQSSGRFGDLSYISIRNVSLCFNFPAKWVKKLHLTKACLYMRGQNVFTFTGRNVLGLQPSTPYALSPMRTVALGFQCSL